MNICLILDYPETPHHPIIAGVLQTLSTAYSVRLLDVNTLSGAQAIAQERQQLASRLEALQPKAYRLAHGSFKPSQLLFHSQYAFVVNFDGFCLADPALDVGCFLAYVRPSGLWYLRPAIRQWFEAAAEVFRSTYCRVMLEHGIATANIDTILYRSQLYEAAFLFKIANRRVNRLNSPRPQELAAMLNEIATNLTYETRRR